MRQWDREVPKLGYDAQLNSKQFQEVLEVWFAIAMVRQRQDNIGGEYPKGINPF